MESNAAGASQHGEGLVETKPVGDDSNQYDPVGTTAVDEAVSQHSTAGDVNEEGSSSEGTKVLQPRRQNEGSARRRRADARDQERHVMEMARARMALRQQELELQEREMALLKQKIELEERSLALATSRQRFQGAAVSLSSPVKG